MAKMRISPELKKLIEKYRCVKDTEGMSPAKVYKLVGENENLYLKMTDSRYKGTTYDVEREKDMMLWLEGKLPVPKVLHFERHDGWSNLLMSEADGVLCSEEYYFRQLPVYRWDEGRGAVRRRQGQRPSGAGRAAGTSRQ